LAWPFDEPVLCRDDRTLIWFYRRKLGGITGDLLGAMVEVNEAILFLGLCAGGGP
jgi:hypothetical protein